jgi:hypothetical protein
VFNEIRVNEVEARATTRAGEYNMTKRVRDDARGGIEGASECGVSEAPDGDEAS